MALAAVSRSSNMRLRGAGVWLTTNPVAPSILSIAPQSGHATSNASSLFLVISTGILCVPLRFWQGLPLHSARSGGPRSGFSDQEPHHSIIRCKMYCSPFGLGGTGAISPDRLNNSLRAPSISAFFAEMGGIQPNSISREMN
jgi:hypothetical protein